MKSKSRFFKRILTYVLVFTLIFSATAVGFVGSVSAETPSDPEVWDGTVAESFAGGTGTEDDPYLIENGGQLYKMVSEYSNVPIGAEAAHTYFEIISDIDLNNQQWYKFATSTNTYENGKYLVIGDTTTPTVGFNGIIEGNGHTIYNLSRVNDIGTRVTGLIPVATQGAEIHNLNLDGGTITPGGTVNNSAYGALIGVAAGSDSSVKIVIEKCSVTRFSITGSSAVGGLVGRVNKQTLEITDCYVNNTTLTNTSNSDNIGQLIGNIVSGLSGSNNKIYISNSYCVGRPVREAANAQTYSYSNVYVTGYDVSSLNFKTGLTTLTEDQMKGEAAKTYMTGFDFENIWKVNDDSYPTFADLLAWNGKVSSAFAGGKGTKADPYLIENGGQLYKMVSEYSNVDVTSRTAEHTYFEITKDINLNNQQWFRFAANTVTDGSPTLGSVYGATVGFNGIIEGNGHTIYNLRRTGSGTMATGLIPLATQGAEIHNLNLENGTISGTYSGNGYAAFIGGAKGGDSSVPIIIENCSVTGFTIESTSAASNNSFAGGFVGYVLSQSIEIRNSYIKDSTITSAGAQVGAFVSYAGGSAYMNSMIIENSYCIGTAPIGNMTSDFAAVTTYTNVYTDVAGFDGTTGIKTLTTEQMQGENAKANMTGFNYNTIWQAGAEGKYPTFWSSDVVGNIWDGTTAFEYASGTGSESDPYIIETAEQLNLLANSDTTETENNYYKLGADIKLANIYDGWEEDNAYQWAKKTVYEEGTGYGNSFAGYFDGDGHTVSGLFYNEAETDAAYAYGLLPAVSKGAVIKNVNIDNANISVSVSSNTYAGAVAGYANVLDYDSENTLNWVQLVNCAVTNSTVTAKNAADILGGANRGVKLELCSSDTENIAPATATCINCNISSDYTKDNIVVITDANSESLTIVRKNLLGITEEYITDINCDGKFDIIDLVRLKKYASEIENEEYQLVFAENFNSKSLNSSVWSTNSLMGVNGAMEFDNAATEAFDGESLTLSVKDNGNSTYKIHQGISTEKSMSFKYGKLEMRAKVPTGAGAFPSFWLSARDSLGYDTNASYSTEIDVFEVFGKEGSSSTLVPCIHKWYNKNGVKTGDECSCGTSADNGNEYIVSASDRSTTLNDNEWHIFTFEWTPDKMVMSMDNVPYYTIDRAVLEELNFDLNGYDTDVDGLFEQFLHIRINNHMYAPDPDGNKYVYTGSEEIDTLKLDYSIDYIRLYQKNDGVSQLKLK